MKTTKQDEETLSLSRIRSRAFEVDALLGEGKVVKAYIKNQEVLKLIGERESILAFKRRGNLNK